jgi:hypothetical protein
LGAHRSHFLELTLLLLYPPVVAGRSDLLSSACTAQQSPCHSSRIPPGDLGYKTPAHASNERTHARAHTTVHNPRHACRLALKWRGSRALANDACNHAANARKWQKREMKKRANTARIPKKSAHVRLHPLTAYSPSVPGIAASRTGWKATRPAKSCCPTPWKMAVSPPCS